MNQQTHVLAVDAPVALGQQVRSSSTPTEKNSTEKSSFFIRRISARDARITIAVVLVAAVAFGWTQERDSSAALKGQALAGEQSVRGIPTKSPSVRSAGAVTLSEGAAQELSTKQAEESMKVAAAKAQAEEKAASARHAFHGATATGLAEAHPIGVGEVETRIASVTAPKATSDRLGTNLGLTETQMYLMSDPHAKMFLLRPTAGEGEHGRASITWNGLLDRAIFNAVGLKANLENERYSIVYVSKSGTEKVAHTFSIASGTRISTFAPLCKSLSEVRLVRETLDGDKVTSSKTVLRAEKTENAN